jgi:uncharacterized iron-regulated protein
MAKNKPSEINSLQKGIYQYIKKKALSYEGPISEGIRKYQKDHKKLGHRPYTLSDIEHLMASIKKSQVIYLGDFHTFDQSLKNLERLMGEIESYTSELVLGVEFIQKEHQQYIDQFLEEEIDEYDFLKSINYHESWRFPWGHYKVFFEMAKKNSYKILALNSEGTLKERDKFAANLICEHVTANPKIPILVMFGEFHIVRNKLPKEVKTVCGRKLKHTIIHQNIDDIYWKLNTKEKTNTQVIKFSSREFSLQTTPPWIKYESMIYWYENMSDDPEFDIHEYLLEQEQKGVTGTTDEYFLYLCNKIAKGLNLRLDSMELEDFNLYGYDKMYFLLKRFETIDSHAVTSFYKKFLLKGKTFKVPFSNIYYCSNYSINKLSFLAGTHIHDILLKDQHIENTLTGNNQTNKFMALFYRCLMAYFSSKIINPYRKCDRFKDIKKRVLNENTHHKKLGNLKLALEILERDCPIGELLKYKSLRGMHSAAKTIGNLVADVLYEDFYCKESKDFDSLFKQVLKLEKSEDKFKWLLDEVLPKGHYKNDQKRFF